MILNGNTGSHEMYLSGRRRRRARARTTSQREVELVDGVEPKRKGTLAERCAWVKLRQRRVVPAGTIAR